jgi:hypothetical protein
VFETRGAVSVNSRRVGGNSLDFSQSINSRDHHNSLDSRKPTAAITSATAEPVPRAELAGLLSDAIETARKIL